MAVSNLRQRGRSLPCGPSGAILCRLWTRDGWWKGMGNYHRRPRSVVTGLGSCCVSVGCSTGAGGVCGRGGGASHLSETLRTATGGGNAVCSPPPPPSLSATQLEEANMGIPRNVLMHLAPTSSLPRAVDCIVVRERGKGPRLCSCCGICSLTTPPPHTHTRGWDDAGRVLCDSVGSMSTLLAGSAKRACVGWLCLGERRLPGGG